jgi:hypothetical protein
MSSREERKRQARAERLAAEARERAAAAARRRRRLVTAGGIGVAAVVGVTAALALGGGGTASGRGGSLGSEGVPVPAGPALAAAGDTASPGHAVDGISCLGGEQVAFHIHAHLTLFVDGRARQVPYAIGIRDPAVVNTSAGPFVGNGSCFAFLHTHAADGIIHIESPVTRTYTLGDFFDIWGQPLGPDRLGPVRGRVLAFDNGRPYTGDPRALPLAAHAQIQLEVGGPRVAPESISFPSGL